MNGLILSPRLTSKIYRYEYDFYNNIAIAVNETIFLPDGRFCQLETPSVLTHLSLASLLWDIGKQNSPRCDAAERGVPSGAILFA